MSNILEKALAAALKSAGSDLLQVAKTAETKLTEFVQGADKALDELGQIAEGSSGASKKTYCSSCGQRLDRKGPRDCPECKNTFR